MCTLTTCLLYLSIGSTLALAKEESTNHDYLVTSASPFILEELGLALLPQNILAQSTETVFQSVFLNLAVPKVPTQACVLPCSPNITLVTNMLNPSNDCWIYQLAVIEAGVLEILKEKTAADCFVTCLLNKRCGLIAYNYDDEICTIQTGKYYRANALDTNLGSYSTRMDCIIETQNVTKEELCENGNPLFDSLVKATLSNHKESVDHLLQKFEDVKKAYDLNLTTVYQQQNKRSWSALDFLEDIPIVGHLYGILKSPSDNRKLKEHLHSLEWRFAQLASVTQEEMTNSREYINEILEVFEAGLKQIDEQMHGIKCDIASLSSVVIYQQTLKNFENKLKQLFSAPVHGTLKTSIPQVLSLEDLRTVTQNNPNFMDTLYKAQPEVLYRVGELYMVKAQSHHTHLMFHFLLTAPKLRSGSLFQTYYRIPQHPHLPRQGVQLNKPSYRVPLHPIIPRLGYLTQLQNQHSWLIFTTLTSKTPSQYSSRRRT